MANPYAPYSFVPYDWDGEYPEDFSYNIVREDEDGWVVNYPDKNENGFPDCMEGKDNPGINLYPSWEHTGN